MAPDRWPRVPVRVTEAQLAGLGGLLTAADSGAMVEVTDGLASGWRRWTGSAWQQLIPNPRQYLNNFVDFVNAVSTGHWAITASGTSAAAATVASIQDTVGVVQASSGTTATGRVFIGAVGAEVDFGVTSRASMSTELRVPTLSTATDTYTLRVGWQDNAAGEATDGLLFRYTNAVNSGKFQAVTRSNGVETAVDTGITVTANTWYELEARWDGTAARFFVNGTEVAVITTNIPTGTTRRTGYGLSGIKSAGTTSVAMFQTDWARVQVDLSVSR